MALGRPGSLKFLMDDLLTAEQPVKTAHDELRLYRWRPNQIELPAIYHWIDQAPFEQRDLTRFRDTINLLTRICVRHTETEEEMAKLETYCDSYREVLDAAVHRNTPLGGSATWAIRTGMRTVLDRFNEIPVLCLELTLQAQLDRLINPT